ncbi:hypothetical protein [Nocardiopsis kunsanensis]|uniref:hypothetical protein n=1 Tax=Nocardiopsis kunsanensis TaxID=141693 RepID=UPI001EF9FF57|nr:hypothetical protein [Nocardiopsis kunsanensis]
MIKAIQTVAFVVAVMGVSGAIDHLFVQPFLSQVLNFFNRFVIPGIPFLEGYELYANLFIAALAVTVLIVSDRLDPNRSDK